MNEGRCISCPVGKYQDDDYHVETDCKSCSGTETFSPNLNKFYKTSRIIYNRYNTKVLCRFISFDVHNLISHNFFQFLVNEKSPSSLFKQFVFSHWKDSSIEAQLTEPDPLLRATVVSFLIYVSWFMGAHHFPCLGCLATVVKPGQGLVTGTTLLYFSVKRIANGCPQGGHLDST